MVNVVCTGNWHVSRVLKFHILAIVGTTKVDAQFIGSMDIVPYCAMGFPTRWGNSGSCLVPMQIGRL